MTAALAAADGSAEARERFLTPLTDDPLVNSLLILHELHPQDTRTRVAAALERVRPYLASHGGNVALVALEDDRARLRLEGNCDGCPSSAITMKLAVEKSIQEAAPEVEHIEIEPASRMAPWTPDSKAVAAPASAEWMALCPLPEFNGGNLATAELSGTKLILCRVGETLYAYRNSCPSCGAAFDGATVRDAVLACAACQRNYDIRRAGRSVDDDLYHLAPLPLLAEDRVVRISIPA
jgi:Fe-S cluster biogenesis protein NfuA/nitrite reductase/ring-hydroxylating ferredoxin subunit